MSNSQSPALKTLVAIPLYNEEATIHSVLEEIRKYYEGDILVINDGSTDRSLEIIQAFDDSSLYVVNHEKNSGYGRSLIDAFDYAITNSYDAVVTIDCDWQHEPKQIPQFFEEIAHWDIVSGSRYYFDQNNNGVAPNDRFRINRLVTDYLNQKTSYKLTDSFCGFKAYKVCALKRLKLTEAGYAMPLQFWVQACFAGLILKEIPVKRIYNNLNRTFGGIMDDPEKRLKYYLEIIDGEISKNECQSNAHCCASR